MMPDELHNIYGAEPGFWWYEGMRAITRALLDPLPSVAGEWGLDAGCGTGYNALFFENHYRLLMCGIDREPLAIQYCRKRSFDRSVVALVQELPFPNNYFSLVTTFDVLTELNRGVDSLALQELLRVLKPGGTLLIRVAAFHALRSRHSQWVSDIHRYRVQEVLGKLKRLDCQVIRWTYANALLVPFALLKFRVWERIRRQEPSSAVTARLPGWLNLLLSSILKTEALLIRWGLCFPFGMSLLVVAQKTLSPITAGVVLRQDIVGN